MSRWVLLVLVGLPYVAVWIAAAVEVVRRRDLGTGRTALWLAALVVLPVVGLAAYVVVRPPRAAWAGQGAAASSSRATQLVLLAERRQRGELSDDDYHVAVAGLRRS